MELRADAPEFLPMFHDGGPLQVTSESYLTPHKLSKSDELEVEEDALVWRVNNVTETGICSPTFWVAGVNAKLRAAYEEQSDGPDSGGLCHLTLECETKTKMKFELAVNGRRSGPKVCLGKKFSTTIKVSESDGPQRIVFQAHLMMP